LPTVKEAQWRIDHKIPWSVPVLVEDEFEGNYVAVLDHDVRERFGRDKRPGLVTNWSRNRLQVYSYLLQTGSWQSFPIQQIVLQIGEQTFMLEGNNNEFVIQPTLALALRDAPLGQVSLSYFNLKGDQLTHPIGDKTVESLHILYRSVSTSTEQP